MYTLMKAILIVINGSWNKTFFPFTLDFPKDLDKCELLSSFVSNVSHRIKLEDIDGLSVTLRRKDSSYYV